MQKTTKKIAEGLGLAALAAGAAATYFFYGQDGKKNRKTLTAWSKKAKEEMVKKIKGMKKVSKANYEVAAKEVLAKYKQIKNIDPKDVEVLGKELKGHWQKISGDLTKLGQTKKPVVKKAVPKAKK
ncbi:MAG: hypothetical protein WC794_04890 [Candidatus Doudnabacteria bacterium]|jgi:uncharacterized protein YktA (UPF0223 family)